MSLEAALQENTATMRALIAALTAAGALQTALQENTATMRELIAALTAAGALQTAQASSAAASSPAVKAVVKAQKEADAKKSDATLTGKSAIQQAEEDVAADAAANASGEASVQTGESSSTVLTADLQPWHSKTADTYAELKDADASLDNVKKAILAINAKISRDQATAVLARFGAQAVTAKPDKTGLDEDQYADFFKLCLDVLSGRVDATASMASE
ncbi:hypothetical protein [Paraburkholderia sartisoli]|uniref:Uncharacterized protein n=1 Tax=Paraburkholderia sartisoli TaxID=83784 RepID=A0A1H4HTH1_9BURK|nr:hypothetical protein [Paraburkholderia sartisoli]SEB24770.1 hypothetical protein SAMN05192564_11519 [Paraburkholderia sartisoli]